MSQTRSLSIRTTIMLPEELAHDAQVVASVDGITFSELVRRAIAEHLHARGFDPDFHQRLAERIEADQRILDRLTEPTSSDPTPSDSTS